MFMSQMPVCLSALLLLLLCQQICAHDCDSCKADQKCVVKYHGVNGSTEFGCLIKTFCDRVHNNTGVDCVSGYEKNLRLCCCNDPVTDCVMISEECASNAPSSGGQEQCALNSMCAFTRHSNRIEQQCKNPKELSEYKFIKMQWKKPDDDKFVHGRAYYHPKKVLPVTFLCQGTKCNTEDTPFSTGLLCAFTSKSGEHIKPCANETEVCITKELRDGYLIKGCALEKDCPAFKAGVAACDWRDNKDEKEFGPFCCCKENHCNSEKTTSTAIKDATESLIVPQYHCMAGTKDNKKVVDCNLKDHHLGFCYASTDMANKDLYGCMNYGEAWQDVVVGTCKWIKQRYWCVCQGDNCNVDPGYLHTPNPPCKVEGLEEVLCGHVDKFCKVTQSAEGQFAECTFSDFEQLCKDGKTQQCQTFLDHDFQGVRGTKVVKRQCCCDGSTCKMTPLMCHGLDEKLKNCKLNEICVQYRPFVTSGGVSFAGCGDPTKYPITQMDYAELPTSDGKGVYYSCVKDGCNKRPPQATKCHANFNNGDRPTLLCTQPCYIDYHPKEYEVKSFYGCSANSCDGKEFVNQGGGVKCSYKPEMVKDSIICCCSTDLCNDPNDPFKMITGETRNDYNKAHGNGGGIDKNRGDDSEKGDESQKGEGSGDDEQTEFPIPYLDAPGPSLDNKRKDGNNGAAWYKGAEKHLVTAILILFAI